MSVVLENPNLQTNLSSEIPLTSKYDTCVDEYIRKGERKGSQGLWFIIFGFIASIVLDWFYEGLGIIGSILITVGVILIGIFLEKKGLYITLSLLPVILSLFLILLLTLSLSYTIISLYLATISFIADIITFIFTIIVGIQSYQMYKQENTDNFLKLKCAKYQSSDQSINPSTSS